MEKHISINDNTEDNFYIKYKFQIDLPKGKWILAEKSVVIFIMDFLVKFLHMLKIEKNKVVEGISIGEMKTAGVYEKYVNQAIHEAMVKNEYHGCYDHPKVLNYQNNLKKVVPTIVIKIDGKWI